MLLEMSRVTKVMSHIIGVRKKADSQKGVRKAADSQKRGWQSKNFVNLCSGLTALFLLLLAKAALAYLATVLSMVLRQLFPSQQAQYVQVFR